MTQPQPAPGPSPSNSMDSRAAKAANDALGGVVVAPTGGGSGNLFGLDKAVANAPVNISSLGLPVGVANPTVQDVMKAFASGDPAVIAQVQSLLMKAGLYDSSKGYTPNYGVVNAEDLKALKEALTQGAQTGTDVGDYLRRQGQFNLYTGLLGTQGKPQKIDVADPQATAADFTHRMERDLGRKATESEKATFVAAFNAAYTHWQRQAYTMTSQAAQGNALNEPISTAPSYKYPTVQNATSPDDQRIAAQRATNDTPQADTGMQPPAGLADALSQPPTEYQMKAFDPNAFADDYVRTHFTGEADAHDIAGQFQNFLTILKGGMR